jgi:hypothetical protein
MCNAAPTAPATVILVNEGAKDLREAILMIPFWMPSYLSFLPKDFSLLKMENTFGN